jgi:hypothetical protein
MSSSAPSTFDQVFLVYRNTVGQSVTSDVDLQFEIDAAMERLLRIIPRVSTIRISIVITSGDKRYQVAYLPKTDAPIV